MTRLLLACALLGCANPPEAPPDDGRSGASLIHHGGALWVTSPDDDAVVVIDPASLEVVRRIAVPGQPRQIVALTDGRVAITLFRAAEVALVGKSVVRWPVPCGGTDGIAVAGDAAMGDRILAVCPYDDRLVVVDPDRGLAATHPAPPRPTSVAVWGEQVIVAASGALHEASRADIVTGDGASWTRREVAAPESRTISTLTGLSTAGGRLFGHYLRVDHDGDRDRPPHRGGYGSVTDDAPRIESRALAHCGGRYARFDGGVRVMSGVSAVAWHPGTGHLWVVNRDTANVAVLACPPAEADPRVATAAEAPLPLVAAFRVGDGARGIALAADGRTAWVDVGFDHAVARLSLDDAGGPGWALPAAVRTRPTAPLHLSPAGERGRRLFHDARNTHLTPSGVVTCASCHPDGGDDGLTWFLHTPGVPRKLRKTPPAWHARPALMPLHWDGELTSAADLVSATIRELMEGDALVVDVHAMATWLSEVVPPVAPPAGHAAERGRLVFEAAGCAGCHAGPWLTDGALHPAIGPSGDADADLAAAVTPTLVGVRGRAPYFHDGRAPDLATVLTAHGEGLSDAERADLLAYLRSL